MIFRLHVTFLALAFLLGGCISTPQTDSLLDSPPDELTTRVRLTHVPFYPQDAYQCGPAALATMLSASGLSVTPDSLIDDVYVPGKQGSYQLELITASRSHNRLPYQIAPSLIAMLKEVQGGNPVLVLQNLGLESLPQWHFAVVKGYDLDARYLLLNSGTIEDYEIPIKLFERTWRRAEYWAFVIPAPGQTPVTAEQSKLFDSLTALESNTNSQSVLRTYYQSALQRWPDDTNLQMGFGNLLFSMGNLESASNIFRQVTVKQPEFAPAFNNLAYTLYTQNKLREARDFAEKAISLGGDFNEQYTQTYHLIVEDMRNQP